MGADSSVLPYTQTSTQADVVSRPSAPRGAGADEHGASRAQGAQRPAGGAKGREAARLGTPGNSSEKDTPEAVAAKRERRYLLRDLAHEVSGAPWLGACGKRPMRGRETIGLRGGDGQRAGWAGIQTCGSWSSCAVCAAKVAAVRGADLSRMIQWGIREGHIVAMMTLTARHHKGQSLEHLWDGMGAAWTHVGRSWGSESEAGHLKRVKANRVAWLKYRDEGGRRPAVWVKPRRVGLRESAGLLGYARATEATYGESGWHVHYHVVLIFDGAVVPKGAEDDHLETFRRDLFQMWRKALRKQGLDAVSTVREVDEDTGQMHRRAVGIDIRRVTGTAELARYLTKMGDAEAASVAAEMKRESDDMAVEATAGAFKQGRKASRSPFEILADVREKGLADDADLWTEWVRVSRGRRQIVWSDGLRALVGLDEDERTDEEIAAEEVGTVDRLVMTTSTWSRAFGDVHLRLRVLELAEEENGIEAVARFFEEIGIRYWRCDDEGQPLPDEYGLVPSDLREGTADAA